VLALGDMVADEYILGRPVRLSREAPLPVLEWVDRYVIPGGAANVARNARDLGAMVAVAGVVGDDEPGRALRQRLIADGIGVDGLIEEANRPTSTKTRVIGGSPQVVSQQMARIDRVVRTEVADETKLRLVDYLRAVLPRVDALIVSDYESGVISHDVVAAALPIAREHRLTIAVDAHGDLWRFRGVTIATPNQDEAGTTLGRELRTDDDVCEAGRDLARQMDARAILITRGGEGMTLVEASGAHHHLPAASRTEVRDVTGAGDTVAAVVTLALSAGASPLEAAHLSNLAASVVIRRLGAATTTPAEMLAALEAWQSR
jgi:rfaE bifunctional protein kinase chain/domain